MVILLATVNWYTGFFFRMGRFIYRILVGFSSLCQMLANMWIIRIFSWWMWFFRNCRWLIMYISMCIGIMNFWILFVCTSYGLLWLIAAKEAGCISFCRFFLALIFMDDNLRKALGLRKVTLSIFSSLSSKSRCCKFFVRMIQFSKIIFNIYFISICLIQLIFTLWISLTCCCCMFSTSSTSKCLLISCGIKSTCLKRVNSSRMVYTLLA